MPTLILSPRYTQDSVILRQSAVQNNWNVHRLSNNWLVNDSERNSPVAIYGEPLFVQYVAEQLSLLPIETPDEWLPSLPYQYTNRIMKIKRIGELEDTDFPAFIKSPNDKAFKAKVYQTLADFSAKEYLPPETIVLFSEPVFWEIEFRCFVHQRECVTYSVYSRNGEVAQDENGAWIASQVEQENANKFLEFFLADCSFDIPKSIVVDVGYISSKGWSVVEANGVWSAGIYGCDPDKVLSLLSDGFRPIT